MHEPNRLLRWICSRLASDATLGSLPVHLNTAPVQADMPLIIVDLDPSADTLTVTGERVVVEVTAGIRVLLEGTSVDAGEPYGDALDAALLLETPEVFEEDLTVHGAVRIAAFTDRLYEGGLWIVRVQTEWRFMCSM